MLQTATAFNEHTNSYIYNIDIHFDKKNHLLEGGQLYKRNPTTVHKPDSPIVLTFPKVVLQSANPP